MRHFARAGHLLWSSARRATNPLGKPGRLASYGLLAVLVGLPGFALWGAMSTYDTGIAARQATMLSQLFEQARFAVGEEESLERKYRLEPSEEVRIRHREAGTAMVDALQRAAILAGPEDRKLILQVGELHVGYDRAIEHMFAAVDDNDTARSNTIDQTEVDPTFDAIEQAVVSLSDRHRVIAADHLDALKAVQTKVLIATPVVFSIGVMLVLFFWRVIRAYQLRAEQSLAREAFNIRLSEQRFRGLVQNTSDLILICTRSGDITYQSPAAETVWKLSASELIGQTLLARVHPDDQAAFRDVWDQVAQSSGEEREAHQIATELRLCQADGGWRETELIGTNLLNEPAVQGVVVTVRDITERKAFEQQLTQQAFFDALTGLPNRVLFRDRLEQALVRAGRRKDTLGVLFLDLDNFKLVNDSLGHQVGDQLLTEAALRLRAAVRAQDTVARLGGDEFVVILELLAGEEDALAVARILAHQFRRPFLLDGREIVTTASIGIALSSGEKQSAEALLRDADLAMYRAKNDGRARYVIFHPSMHTDSLARLELENDLRAALPRGELRVYYQPIIDIGSGEFTEVEALVRWRHPTKGTISPGEFIPAAEETGLIVPLGMWVLEEACRQVAGWNRQAGHRPPLTLSVNLSPRQFQQASLVADVKRALDASGLPACCLKLEITESSIMHDAEATIRTLWDLKNLGLQLAIDDFGTGYSSLSYLKRLPLDVLKIDRSFISGIGHSHEDTAIVHAIMALAKSLNLKVTGEGIESREQAALLGELGCDRGQGYLFSTPLASDKAGAFLGFRADMDRRSDLQPGEPARAMT